MVNTRTKICHLDAQRFHKHKQVGHLQELCSNNACTKICNLSRYQKLIVVGENIKKFIKSDNFKSVIVCKKMSARSKAQRRIHNQNKIVTHDNRKYFQKNELREKIYFVHFFKTIDREIHTPN